MLLIFLPDFLNSLQIFTSDEVELPRARVDQFLESFDPELCIRYLHHLIDDRGEQNVQFHNRLGLLLISVTANYEKKGRDGELAIERLVEGSMKIPFFSFIQAILPESSRFPRADINLSDR
jgi:hypothetical protein